MRARSLQDGSFLRGTYRISQLKAGVKHLIFETNKFSLDTFEKETDLLRSIHEEIIVTGLNKKNVNIRNDTMTILCVFLDKG